MMLRTILVAAAWVFIFYGKQKVTASLRGDLSDMFTTYLQQGEEEEYTHYGGAAEHSQFDAEETSRTGYLHDAVPNNVFGGPEKGEGSSKRGRTFRLAGPKDLEKFKERGTLDSHSETLEKFCKVFAEEYGYNMENEKNTSLCSKEFGEMQFEHFERVECFNAKKDGVPTTLQVAQSKSKRIYVHVHPNNTYYCAPGCTLYEKLRNYETK